MRPLEPTNVYIDQYCITNKSTSFEPLSDLLLCSCDLCPSKADSLFIRNQFYLLET